MAASLATLSACAHSPATLDRPAGPAVVTRTDRTVETVCPAELGNPLPARMKLPTGASVSGNDAGMAYMAGRFRREDQLETVIEDARAACPKPPG